MSTTNHAPETPTPSSRYPSKLSRNYRSAGQLRQPTSSTARNHNNNNNNNNNNHRGKQRNKRNQYPAPSIDHHSRPIPNRPAPSTNPVIRIKELSSLQELLQQAGYKDTRVYTPEAEKIRQIKKTFEDEEVEELNDLYGTFGLQRRPSTRPMHQIQNVTEPTVPFRSSSAMLRNLALQDSKLNDQESLASSPSSWWEGGMAALGKAAKAVAELSPPAKGEYPVEHAESSPARWNDQIRKAKSDVALSTGSALARIEVPQEQRPPTVAPAPQVMDISSTGTSSSLVPQKIVANTFNPPPPSPLDEDAFGYSPLPSGYEAQWDEDSGLFDPRPFEIDSTGSYDDSLGEDEEQDSEEAQTIDRDLSAFSHTDTYEEPDDDLGRRILEGALQYDDVESPPITTSPLPDVGITFDEAGSGGSVQSCIDAPSSVPKPPLKYADRATKLRIAKSTPVLQSKSPTGSWLASWRQVFVGTSTDCQSSTHPEPELQTMTGPLKISPSIPAAPTLVTKSTVVCDSASDSAFDLPPVDTKTRRSAGDMLRLRPSFARLKQAVFANQTVPVKSEDVSPTLSPRLDWDTQGEHYAGWNWSTKKQRPSPVDAVLQEEAPTPDFKAKGSIDYTKSFFYKPATPPRNPAAGTSRPTPERTTSEPQVRARRSIKSLKAALLLPVAAPPVPQVPAQYSRLRPSSAITPPKRDSMQRPEPPVLAIQSPGAWEAGLPPRALVLEGEEWDARDGNVPGDWGRRASKKGASRKLKKSSFEF